MLPERVGDPVGEQRLHPGPAGEDLDAPMPRAAGSRSRAEVTSEETSLATRRNVPRPSTLRSLGTSDR